MTHHLALIPLAIGHVSLFVLVVNVTHGMGYSERAMSRTKVALVTIWSVGSAALAWELYRGPFSEWSWPSLLYALVCVATGLVFLPMATLYLHTRPRPEGIRREATTTDLAQKYGVAALTGPGRHAWMFGLPGNESLKVRAIEWEVPIPGLPIGLDGLSILHLTDLHFATCYDRRYFDGLFDIAARLPADLVVFTGDLVDDEETLSWVVPLLSRVSGRLGSFAVLGNHDYMHHPSAITRAIEEGGFQVIEGGWASVDHLGTTVALGGTSSPWGPLPTPDQRPESDFSILLSHSPDKFYWAEKQAFDLMLSGHNHGGQIRLPLVGPVFTPSIYSRRFDRGFFRRGGLTLHVSQGIGGMHPVRYGCVPEIGRLVLRYATAGNKEQRAYRGKASGVA